MGNIHAAKKDFTVFIITAISNKIRISVSNNMGSEIARIEKNSSDKNENGSKIVYYESLQNKRQALKRQKELRSLNRKKLNELIRKFNPELLDFKSMWENENQSNSRIAFF